jgi:hydrogenase maturation protease
VKFLQAVERRVGQWNPEGGLDFVESLQVGSERYLAWEEAREQERAIEFLKLPDLTLVRRFAISISAGAETENIVSRAGETVGAFVRSWHSIAGGIEVSAESLQQDLFRLTVRICNLTPWSGHDREAALKQTFLSTHTDLQVEGGEFISLTDPPETFEAAAKACQNLRTWPVLAGQPGEKQYALSSPIILPDYPQIAPESPGNLFDNSEVDQLLFLNILALTDEEKQEIRATDPKAREILERSESLTMDDFMNMHGVIRDFRTLREIPETNPLFDELEKPVPESRFVDGVELRKGNRVRLEPRPGGDIWDIALAGKIAFIEKIEQDYDGHFHVVVSLEEDPGRELDYMPMLGHRFFFSPEEVKPILADAASAQGK